MENTDEPMGTLRQNSHPKVHGTMCNELSLMLDKVSSVLPSIEAAQPGCKAGVEELCNLYNIVDKGKLIIQNCIECSSLYLAITSEATAMWCERIRNSLRRSLFLIQNMVEQLLANEVADIHNDLRDVKFVVDPVEEDAGKVILEMLRQSEVSHELELQTFLVAASKLNITSPKAILIERRAIKKLLAKINATDPKKEGILKYLLYLVRKYGKNTKGETGKNHTVDAGTEIMTLDVAVSDISTPERCFSTMESGNVTSDDQTNLLGAATPPPELCCPMSMKLMQDPVIIASGQTYERENIEKWFNQGYDTCPRTQMKLQNFTVTPNNCMKAVIYNWCKDRTYFPEPFHSSYSVSSLHNFSAPLITEKNRDSMVDYSSSSCGLSAASYASSLMREAEQSKASFDHEKCCLNANFQLYFSFCNFDKAMFMGFFHELSELPLELQCKAVKDLKTTLNGENQIWHSMVCNGFFEAFHEFLRDDSGRCTLQARRVGIQFFLAFLFSGRSPIPSSSEDVILLIALLLDFEFKREALLIIHELLQEPSCRKSNLMACVVAPFVFGALDSGDTKCLDLALKIICKISSDNDIKFYLFSSGIISKLSPLLRKGRMTQCSLKILRNLSEVKEATEFIRTENCLGYISDHLDTGSHREREHAAVILLAVCSDSAEVCSLAMKEGVIPALVDLSVNGTEVARDCSIQLLQLLRDFRRCNQINSSCSREVAAGHLTENPENDFICKQQISKSARYISRKLNIFSKPRSLTLA